MNDIRKYMSLLENAEHSNIEKDYHTDENLDEIDDSEYVTIEDEFILPSDWNTALLHGDYSTLSDEEKKEVDKFLEEFPLANYITSDIEELGFRQYNDANKKGQDVSLYKAFKKVPKEEATDELLEAELKMGVIETENQLRHKIAKDFSKITKDLNKLNPVHKKEVSKILQTFLKDDVVDLMNVKKVFKMLENNIEETGDAYDNMATYLQYIKNVLS
ncbi:hypothetical protein PBI_SCTP2_458 [Salicola phage SCTP-2]|nr:hypothetical protein PBI_SCTP2_458 [Salicola phage SCTP-2]